MLVPQRQVDRAARGDDGSLMVSHSGVIANVAGRPNAVHIGANRCFVFAMGTDGQRRFGKDALQGVLIVDQQIAGARTDEDFYSWRAPRLCQFGNIVAGGTDIETVIHQALLGGQRQLCIEPRLIDGGRHRVGHLEKRGHAPLGASSRGASQVFFMRESRLAKVNLIIDHARQEMQAGGIDRFIGCDLNGRVNLGDFVACEQHRCLHGALGQHDRGVFDERFHGNPRA